MPKRTKTDEEKVLAVFEQTGSGRQTARLLDLHENTVYQILRVHRKQCRICGNPIAPNRKYCAIHLAHLREAKQEQRKERKRQGVCAECDNRIMPPSKAFCDVHRIKHQKAVARSDTKTRINAPSKRDKERRIRSVYGESGIAVWRKAQSMCMICNIHHEDSRIVLHHLDKIQANNVEENLVCLCHKCHQLTHILSEHTAPMKAIQWICTTYNLTMPGAD